jgi:hypothetical protein
VTARVSPAWLALREPADAAARAADLVEPIRRRLAGNGPALIHDLGTGTGSMGRWLAPRLPGPQHWIMYDRDPDLLDLARTGMTGMTGITVETRLRDITRLTVAELGGASLITASALLDMFTADELDRVVHICAGAGCPALLTISVLGEVQLTPPDPLDAEIVDAFNAHQRRTVDGRALLGPDAVDRTVDLFRRMGITVLRRPSPWLLRAEYSELIFEWFAGWVGAACEQRPELSGPVQAYSRRRLAELEAGRLTVVVPHCDLLAGCE